MRLARTLPALVVAAALAGCHPVELGDTAVSGLLESEIGSDKGQLAPTATGTLLGEYSGTEVGRALDAADRRYAEESARNALESSPTGQTAQWRNPANNHAGSFTPTNLYRSLDDLRCRDYVQTVTIDGRTQRVDGAACQAADGSWRVITTSARRSILPEVRRQIDDRRRR
jgi:surface antigen